MILYVTNRCNFRCDFCFYADEIDKGSKPDEMTLEEITELAKRTGPLLQLSMTGGEPFLRKDFADVASVLIKHTRARFVTIPTNGSLTDRMVAFFERILPEFPDTYFRLVYSIEGIGSDHDDSRSMPGSYDKIRESFAALKGFRERFSNLVIDSNSVFTTNTENTLVDTLKHLSEEFEFDNLSVTYARGQIRDPELKCNSEDNYIKVNEFLESLIRTKEKRFLYPVWRGVRDVSREALIRTEFHDEFVSTCVAGRKLVVVSETGEVFPCEILDKSMGNLRDYDFDLHQLMSDQKTKELANWIVESKCKCTFECALAANVVWNFSNYPKLIKSALKNIGQK